MKFLIILFQPACAVSLANSQTIKNAIEKGVKTEPIMAVSNFIETQYF